MRAVLREVGDSVLEVTFAASLPHWAMLKRALEGYAALPSDADGAASAHSHAARQEAAHKLIGNHENVLRDLTNPWPTQNIVGAALTQMQLERVEYGLAMYADQALREVARRLLGQRPGLHQLESLEPGNSDQAHAWVGELAGLDPTT